MIIFYKYKIKKYILIHELYNFIYNLFLSLNVMKSGKSKINKKKNPFTLLSSWYEEAIKKESKNPNAMALSTVGSFNRPRVRMVLMKEIRKDGIVFLIPGLY